VDDVQAVCDALDQAEAALDRLQGHSGAAAARAAVQAARQALLHERQPRVVRGTRRPASPSRDAANRHLIDLRQAANRRMVERLEARRREGQR